jgi:hypothetical protein
VSRRLDGAVEEITVDGAGSGVGSERWGLSLTVDTRGGEKCSFKVGIMERRFGRWRPSFDKSTF